jgi:hypothetical protein
MDGYLTALVLAVAAVIVLLVWWIGRPPYR